MILKELPIGSKVREQKSSVIFLVADHNHTAYAGTTLVTDCAIKVASFDAAEPDNPDKAIKEFGNNFYPLSNIHQWLNTNETDWYKPAHEFDAPPVVDNIDMGRLDFYDVPFYSEDAKFTGDFSYKNDSGFLTWFSPEFVNSIFEVKVHCYMVPKPGEIHDGPVTPFNLKTKVFLLSAAEMGFETRTNEGFRFPLFNDPRIRVVAPTPTAIHRPVDYIYNDCSFWYWLRTPVLGSTSMAMHYNSDHKIGDNNPSSAGQLPVRAISGIRPAMNLNSGIIVSREPDALGIYTLLFGGK
jgi:hypothetical protein